MSAGELDLRAWFETAISLRFSSQMRICVVDAVLDLDRDGEVVGLEVLYLRSQCGDVQVPTTASVATAGTISMAIDHDSDAMYVRISQGTSSTQVDKAAVIAIGQDDVICEIYVPR